MANTILGNAEDNRLTGFGGHDPLLGDDGLTGGTGADRFVVSALRHTGSPQATAPVISDFALGDDGIRLNALFTPTAADFVL